MFCENFQDFPLFFFIQRRCRSRCCHHRQRNEIAGNLMGGGCVFVRETAVGDAVTIHTHTHTYYDLRNTNSNL